MQVVLIYKNDDKTLNVYPYPYKTLGLQKKNLVHTDNIGVNSDSDQPP